MSDDGAPPDPATELAQLRKELQRTKRQLEQLTRVAETSQAIAVQSKHAMLRTNEELTSLVGELRQAKADAEQAAHAKGRFLAMMSHELRTPLHGMVGSTELLIASPLSPSQTEIVQLLHRSSTSLLTIVNDILDYSRIEAGLMPIEAIPFHLEESVREVLGLQAGAAAKRNLHLHHTIDAALPTFVIGDPGRLRQVLNNLISNAMKFTTRGEVVVCATPTTTPDLIEFSVRDTGVGIHADAIGRLFQAFVQEDVSTTRRFGGTGLGLAISKRLVELMGGTIGVVSEQGRGSTFTFTCRLAAADHASLQTEVPAPPANASVLALRRVLIVDDNDGNRLLMRRMLQKLGCASEEACDGMQAVERIAARRYDLVLMDCSMPVMDGYEATRAVRTLDNARRAVPIVALTANALPEDRQRCLEAGMNGYLSKPVRLAALQAELARCLQD